jgi:hypothetical protein
LFVPLGGAFRSGKPPRDWAYPPSGGISLVLLVFVILVVTGRV